MLYNKHAFGIPLLPHQYHVAGVVEPPHKGYGGRYFYDGQQYIVYGLQPYWKSLIENGDKASPYCVEDVPTKGVCVLVPSREAQFARGVAALMGMDVVLTSRTQDLLLVRDFLKERGVRYTETAPYIDDRIPRAPFNLDDADLEVATEIKMMMEGIEVKRSRLASLVGRELPRKGTEVVVEFLKPSPTQGALPAERCG